MFPSSHSSRSGQSWPSPHSFAGIANQRDVGRGSLVQSTASGVAASLSTTDAQAIPDPWPALGQSVPASTISLPGRASGVCAMIQRAPTAKWGALPQPVTSLATSTPAFNSRAPRTSRCLTRRARASTSASGCFPEHGSWFHPPNQSSHFAASSAAPSSTAYSAAPFGTPSSTAPISPAFSSDARRARRIPSRAACFSCSELAASSACSKARCARPKSPLRISSFPTSTSLLAALQEYDKEAAGTPSETASFLTAFASSHRPCLPSCAMIELVLLAMARDKTRAPFWACIRDSGSWPC